MSRGADGAALVLTVAGVILILGGVAGIVVALAFAEEIHALLPDEITSDPAAIGGAAMALGVTLLLGGGLHLAVAAANRRGRWLVAGVLLAVVMAALAVGWAVTAFVSAAAGTAPLAAMLAAGGSLSIGAAAYARAAAALLGARRAGRGLD